MLCFFREFFEIYHILEQAMPLTLRDEPYVWAEGYNRKKKTRPRRPVTRHARGPRKHGISRNFVFFTHEISCFSGKSISFREISWNIVLKNDGLKLGEI